MTTTPAACSALAWLRAHAPEPANAHEAVALAVHALLLHHDFRPANTMAEAGQPETPAQTESPSASPSSDPSANGTALPSTLPTGWGGAGFGGQYRHVRSAMLFDIRAVRMGGRLVVHAVAGEDDSRMHTVDVRVHDFITQDDAAEPAWQDLHRMDDLATLVAVQIAHRLVPEGAKHGYEDGNAGRAAEVMSTGRGEASESRSQPGAHRIYPLVGEGSDDVHDPLRIGPVRGPGLGMPRMPFGEDDITPALGRVGGSQFRPGGNLMGPGHFATGGRPLPPGAHPDARFHPYGAVPDPDVEIAPGFDDEHGLRGPPAMGGPGGRPFRGVGGVGRGDIAPFGGGVGRGGLPFGGGRGGGSPFGGGGGGLDDDGPPPGMFF